MSETQQPYTVTSATAMPPDYLRGAHVMTLTDKEYELVNLVRNSNDLRLAAIAKIDDLINSQLQKMRGESRYTGSNLAVVDFIRGIARLVSA